MTSFVDIKKLIEKKADLVEQLRKSLADAEAELRGMKNVQELLLASMTTVRISDPVPRKKRERGYKGGRQPGAISQSWRCILSEIYWFEQMIGHGAQISDIREIAQRVGITIRPSEIQSRMLRYMVFDYVVKKEGRYSVTLRAAKKFGFDKEPIKESASEAKSIEG